MRRPTIATCTSSGSGSRPPRRASSRLASFMSPGATIDVADPAGVERGAQGASALGGPLERLRRLHHRMRHHEDRGATTGLLQVGLAERRMHDDPSRRLATWAAHGSRRRFVADHVGRAEVPAEPSRLARRHEPQRVPRRLQPAHEVVEREVVQHDQRAGEERGAVDLQVELHVVAELEDAQVIAGEPDRVPRFDRPQHVHAVTLVEPDPLAARPAPPGRTWRCRSAPVAADRRRPVPRPSPARCRARPGRPWRPGGGATRRQAFALARHQSRSRATTSGQRGTSARISALPALPNRAAASRSRWSRSNASAIARRPAGRRSRSRRPARTRADLRCR